MRLALGSLEIGLHQLIRGLAKNDMPVFVVVIEVFVTVLYQIRKSFHLFQILQFLSQNREVLCLPVSKLKSV
jgi:hypothetical protein